MPAMLFQVLSLEESQEGARLIPCSLFLSRNIVRIVHIHHVPGLQEITSEFNEGRLGISARILSLALVTNVQNVYLW
jgi:hypothetical protein